MRVKAVMTVTVWIDDAESEEEVREHLTWCGYHIANRGLLTPEDSPSVADTWNVNVTTEEVMK